MGWLKKKLKWLAYGWIQDTLQWALGIDKPEKPSAEVNIQSTEAHIPVIYGTRKMGGIRVYAATSGNDNKYLYMAIVLCEGEVSSIGDVYLDDVISTDSKFNGLVTIQKFTGTDTQAASSLLMETSGWDSSYQLKGLAYLAVKLEFNKDKLNSLPTITCIVNGKKCYNPFTLTTGFTDNPVVCLYDYLTNTRYGKGMPSSAIDLTTFQAAYDWIEDPANLVTSHTGTTDTEQLFAINLIVDTGQTLFDNVNEILASMRAFMPYIEGKYGLILDKDLPAGYQYFDFNDDNIIGTINYSSSSKNDTFNRVRARFDNPATLWKRDEVIWPEKGSAEEIAFLAADNGEVLEKTITLTSVTSQYVARDYARLVCLMSRSANETISFNATSDALVCSVGDVVRIANSTMGWTTSPDTRQLFRITEITIKQDATIAIDAVKYDPSIYPWDVGTEILPVADTALPDPLTIFPPTDLVIGKSTSVQNDGSVAKWLDISWAAPVDNAFLDSYVVIITPSGGTSSSFRVYATEFRYLITASDVSYTVLVRSVSTLGSESTAISDTILGVDLPADTTPPSVPVAGTPNAVVGQLNSIHLYWTNPTDADFSYIEIHRSADATFGNGALLASTGGTEYVDGEFNAVTTFHYWVRALDTSGNGSAWVYLGSGTSRLLIADDFGDGVIGFDFFDTSLQTTINDKLDTSVYNAGVTTINNSIALKADAIDVDAIVGDVSDTRYDAIDLAESVLKNALDTHKNAKTMSDAGIQVNPNDGTVYIYALDVYKGVTDSRLGSAEIRLDGAESTINLKAEYTYVDQAIAEAVFDPSQVADLTDLYARVGQAEIDIDAAEADILLKADLTLLNDPTTGVIARVTQAELDIDALEGEIVLKTSTSDFDLLEGRVSTAETTLTSIDAPQISQTVRDVLFLTDETIDLANTSLEGLLAYYEGRKETMAALASASQSLTADVIDARNVFAEYRLELLAKTDANEASIISESLARIAEDESLASQITTLNATTAANTASIIATDTVVTTNTTAIAENKIEIDARLDTAEGSITQINTVDLSSTSAIAQSVAQLQLDVGESGLSGQIQDIQDIISDESSIRANDITTLAVTQGYQITDLETQTMNDILQGYEDRKTLQAALAIARQSLTADINDSREALSTYRLELIAAIDNNTAQITQEATARATQDEALAQTITTLEVDVQGNTAAITTEQQVRANADSVIAADVLTLEGRVDTTEADITQINFIDVSSTSAIASQFASTKTTVDGHTTTITQNTSSINGIEGRYAIGINNNGHVSGFGLISQMNPDSTDPKSAFVIAADQFAITNEVSAPQWSEASVYYAVDTQVYHFGKLYKCLQAHNSSLATEPPTATHWQDITDYAFVVYTTEQQITKDGQAYTIPAGVYMRDGFIQTAAVGTANVRDSAITNAKIGGIIQSDANATDGNPKWSIDKDGGAVFRGIEIRGDDGTLLMASGSAMDYTAIGGTKPPSNADNTASNNQGASWLTDSVVYSGNKISSANIGTYISSLAVGTLYIGDNAVTLPDFGSLIFTLDSEKYIAKGVTKTTDDILFVEGRTDANAVVTATILIYPLHSATGGLSTSYANFDIYVVALDYNAVGTLLGTRQPMGIDNCALAARTSQNFTFSLLDIPITGTVKTKYRIKVTCNSTGTGAYGVGIDYPTITFLEVKK